MTTPSLDLDQLDYDASFGSAVAEEAARRKGGGSFNRLDYFKLEDFNKDKAKGAMLMRLLSDLHPVKGVPQLVPWMTVNQHAMVATKPAPAGHGDKRWPTKMGGVCRHDKLFRGFYEDPKNTPIPGCCICDQGMKGPEGKPSPARPRTWALAVRREEVVENGEVVGVRDATKEVAKLGPDGKPTDEVERVKDIIVINQAWDNFFALLVGAAGRTETLLDRDVYVKRIGSGIETEYRVSAEPPITMPDGKVYDLRDPEVLAAKFPDGVPDLRKIVADKAGDDLYGRFFDARISAEDLGGSGGGQAQQDRPSAPSGEVPSERMAAMRERVLARNGAPASEAQQAAGPAAAASGRRALD